MGISVRGVAKRYVARGKETVALAPVDLARDRPVVAPAGMHDDAAGEGDVAVAPVGVAGIRGVPDDGPGGRTHAGDGAGHRAAACISGSHSTICGKAVIRPVRAKMQIRKGDVPAMTSTIVPRPRTPCTT